MVVTGEAAKALSGSSRFQSAVTNVDKLGLLRGGYCAHRRPAPLSTPVMLAGVGMTKAVVRLGSVATNGVRTIYAGARMVGKHPRLRSSVREPGERAASRVTPLEDGPRSAGGRRHRRRRRRPRVDGGCRSYEPVAEHLVRQRQHKLGRERNGHGRDDLAARQPVVAGGAGAEGEPRDREYGGVDVLDVHPRELPAQARRGGLYSIPAGPDDEDGIERDQPRRSPRLPEPPGQPRRPYR